MPTIARLISHFTPQEVTQAFKMARRVKVDPAFTLLRSPGQKSFGRILIVTSRKVGSAPQRNKIRRQIKAIFYQNRLFLTPFDYIFIAKKPSIALSFEQLLQIMLDAANS